MNPDLPWSITRWLPCQRCDRIPALPGDGPPCRCAETVPAPTVEAYVAIDETLRTTRWAA